MCGKAPKKRIALRYNLVVFFNKNLLDSNTPWLRAVVTKELDQGYYASDHYG